MGKHYDCEALERNRLGGSDMSNETMTDVLVKLGRIEEILNLLLQKVDRLEEDTKERFAHSDVERDRIWKKLNAHDTELEVIKQRQGPRVPFVSWLAIVASIIAVALNIIERYVNG